MSLQMTVIGLLNRLVVRARWLNATMNIHARKNETVLVVIVPEVEVLVGRFRAAHDPSASKGMPAHITINYPFIPDVKLSDDTFSRLSEMFAAIEPFSFALDHIARFPNVVYLAPSPSLPFVHLVSQIAREFPESPPYGGQFDSITPI